MKPYETVIGIEVHVELNTSSKMFCRCSANYFGAEPNTHTCPVCLGLPGALPVINNEAINKCIQIGLALGCEINKTSYFERKNYFYPDLAKGFQTSQLILPIAVKGEIEVEDEKGNKKKIRINRAHQEEDTGKLTHQGNETLIDFNRSSVPLVEIVTEPDFNNPLEVRDYAKKLQQIFRYLGVSNADMEKGEMRLEANVSVREVGDTKLPPYRVELKNINSFRFMVAAIEYEIKRQIEATEKGEKLVQETRGWDQVKKRTYVQRSKEEAHDYRYFPEPDLPELRIEESRVELLKMGLPELPQGKVTRYVNDLKIKEIDAKILVDSKELADFFESVVEHGKAHEVGAQQIANFIINQKPDIEVILPTQIIEEIKNKKVGAIEGEAELEEYAKEVLVENQAMVEQYKGGKTTVIMAFVGAVMKKTAGKANAQKTKEILEKLLA